MTGQINVNKIAARTGNTINIESGDTLVQPHMPLQIILLIQKFQEVLLVFTIQIVILMVELTVIFSLTLLMFQLIKCILDNYQQTVMFIQ